MTTPPEPAFCPGDRVLTSSGGILYVIFGRFVVAKGVIDYRLVHGDLPLQLSYTILPEEGLTLLERGVGPRWGTSDVLLLTTTGQEVAPRSTFVHVQEGERLWWYNVQPLDLTEQSLQPETNLTELDGTVPPQPVPCPPLATCSLVERNVQGSGEVLSGVTTGIGFLETVTLVATIQDDPDRLAVVTWESSHGDIISQDYNTAVWLAPEFETPAIVAIFISGVIQLDCRSTFQTPPVPIGTPGLLSCLHIEEAPRASGRIFSGVMTNVEPGQTIELVATILLDDGRRNNTIWNAQFGSISNPRWDLATYTAPSGAGLDTVDITIDNVIQYPARCLFAVPAAPLADPDLTQLEDFLHVDFWKTLAYRMSQGVEQTREGIPFDIRDARDFLAGLGQQTLDNVVGIPSQITDLLSPEFQTLSFNILAGMENVMEPIFGAAFNPIQTAIQALPIPTPLALWESFWDQLGVLGQAPVTAVVNFFLEALEVAMATIGGPLWARILAVDDLPPWVRDFIQELANPTSQVAALFGQAAGGAAVSGSVTGIIAPALRSIEQWANIRGPNVPLDQGSTVAAHVRGFIERTPMEENLARLGFAGDPVNLMVDLTIPRLDIQSINLQVNRWELQQAAVTAGPLAQELATAFDAGISPEAGDQLLALLGYESRSREQLLDQRHILPSVGDLIRYAVREAFGDPTDPGFVERFGLDDEFPPEILPFTRGQGLPDLFATMEWRAHWELPSIQQGFEMLHRSRTTPYFPGQTAGSGGLFTVIDDGDLDSLFKQADVLPFWRERLKNISFAVVTRVDVRRLYDMNIYDLDKVREVYRSLGYTADDAQSLTEFVERLAIQPRLTARNTEARQQYRDGLIDRNQAFDLLRPLIHLDVELEEELTTLDLDRRGTRLAREVTAWQAAFRKDLVEEAEFRTELTRLTIPAEEIDFRVQITGITRVSDDLPPERREIQVAGRAIIVRRFREGLTDLAQFGLEMSSVGYTDKETGLFAVQADLEFETNLTLDLLAAYRAGLRTGRLSEAEFRASVGELGIRPELVDAYVEFDTLRRKLQGPTGEEAEIRALGSGPVISRFQEGWTQEPDFRLEMESLGYTDPEIDRYQVLADLRFDFDFKQDSLTVIRSAFNRGVIVGDEFLSRLATLGMDQARAQVHLAREQLRLLDRAEPPEPSPALPGG